jgi:hypothetical protein
VQTQLHTPHAHGALRVMRRVQVVEDTFASKASAVVEEMVKKCADGDPSGGSGAAGSDDAMERALASIREESVRVSTPFFVAIVADVAALRRCGGHLTEAACHEISNWQVSPDEQCSFMEGQCYRVEGLALSSDRRDSEPMCASRAGGGNVRFTSRRSSRWTPLPVADDCKAALQRLQRTRAPIIAWSSLPTLTRPEDGSAVPALARLVDVAAIVINVQAERATSMDANTRGLVSHVFATDESGCLVVIDIWDCSSVVGPIRANTVICMQDLRCVAACAVVHACVSRPDGVVLAAQVRGV